MLIYMGTYDTLELTVNEGGDVVKVEVTANGHKGETDIETPRRAYRAIIHRLHPDGTGYIHEVPLLAELGDDDELHNYGEALELVSMIHGGF